MIKKLTDRNFYQYIKSLLRPNKTYSFTYYTKIYDEDTFGWKRCGVTINVKLFQKLYLHIRKLFNKPINIYLDGVGLFEITKEDMKLNMGQLLEKYPINKEINKEKEN